MALLEAGLGAAAAVAGSAASAGIQSAGTKRAVKEAAKYNLAQWNRENEYNHPSQQMARLAEAGLNPNMLYGSSASGASGNAASSAPRMEPAQYRAPEFGEALSGLAAYSDFRVKQAQTDNLAKQNDVIVAQTLTEAAKAANLTQQTAESVLRTARSKFDLGLAESLRANSIDVAQQNLMNMRQNYKATGLDILLKGEEMKYKPLQRMSLQEQIKNLGQERQRTFYDTMLKKYEHELNLKGLTKSDSVILRQIANGLGTIPSRETFDDVLSKFTKNPKVHLKALWKFKNMAGF